MFVTGLTPTNIINREPAIAEYITDYATTLQTRIDEAKAVIDNKLRALGYDLDKIGKKTDIWDWDNEASEYIEQTITSPDSTQLLLVLIGTDAKVSELVVHGKIRSQFYIIPTTSFTLDTSPNSFILPFIDTEITVSLNADGAYSVNSVKAYLTDPAIYFVHLYKSLHLIYESMRSNPGDIFEMKSNYYSDLYENEMNNLVTYYDRNADGTSQANEFGTLKRTMIKR